MTLSFLVSSQIPVNDDTLKSLIGRDELVIIQQNYDKNVIGTMTIDIEKSVFKREECLFVSQVRNI